MIKEITTYSLDDLCIVPKVFSDISSRKECEPYYDSKLPIFTAPMSCVVSEANYEYWYNLPLNVIIPRSCPEKYRKEMFTKGHWVAVGLDEWNSFIELIQPDSKYRILIDVANGHMQKIATMIQQVRLKHSYEGLEIMVGNIANPSTFRAYSAMGVNYIRCAIGAGNQCITATQTGIYFPMASLIDACRQIANHINDVYKNGNAKYPAAKIIADGGMRRYRDIITALACGADYVMVGSMFGAMWESAAEGYCKTPAGMYETAHWDVSSYEETLQRCGKGNFYKELYGMASRKAQQEIAVANGSEYRKKTSEGKTSYVPCTGHIHDWLKNFEDYLRSAMSYTGARTLEEFTTQTVLILCSPSERARINA